MWIGRALLVSTLATGGVIAVAAAPATAAIECAGYFCAYDTIGLERPLLKSNAPVGSKVDVADDRISSAENNTNNRWDGRNRRWGPVPDSTVYRWQPGDIAFELGEADNKIDHFDVHPAG